MPKWFKPVVVVALLWNLMGCLAYLADVMVSPEAIAKMSAAEQAPGTAPLVLQGLVLLVCVGLVQLARTAETQGWIGAAKPSPLKRG